MVASLLAGRGGSSVDGGGSRGGRGRGGHSGSGLGAGGSSRGGLRLSGSRGHGRAGGSRARGGGGRGTGGSGGRSTGGVGAEGQGGTGDGVGGEVGVKVEDDAVLGLGVERGTGGTVGQLGAGAGDLQVEALGVVLGTVRVLGRVESDDLVADDVVTGLERRGDGDVVGEAVVDQVVCGPGTGVGAADQTSLIDLDPRQSGLVNGGGVIGLGNVGDDGAVVLWHILLVIRLHNILDCNVRNTYRVGPGVPGSSEGTTGGNGSVVQETVGSILVADDVGGTVGIGGDVAVVRGRLGPSVELIASVGTGSGSPLLIVTSEGLAVNGPGGDVTVSADEAGTGGQGQNNGSFGRHF